MDNRRIEATLDLLSEDELRRVPHWIDIYERWNMSPGEAKEWRRRIAARRERRVASSHDPLTRIDDGKQEGIRLLL